jgi:transcriptional regulator with PAS, ATPase and Fis domain
MAQIKERIIGASEYIKKLRIEIDNIAPTTDIILIEGPTGTGKELIANEIHIKSKRREFVPVNCAAIAKELFEAELFGVRKGAFTGAENKTGLVEVANHGTLFFDEVGELALEHQAKLLRFLDNYYYRKVGDEKEHHTNVRVIAATNRDLLKAIAQGRFREDLYHRLSQCILKTEPLAGKIEDIICLVNHFSKQNGSGDKANPWSKLILYYYLFPGNVRELKNLVGKPPDYIRSWIKEREHIDEHKNVSYGMDQLDEDLLSFDEDLDSWKEVLGFIKHDFSSEDEENLNLLRDAIMEKKLTDEERKEAHKLYEEILEKRARANRNYRDRVIEHGLRVFEILILNQKAKLNTDKLHEALHIRYQSVPEFEEKYCITFPHGKERYEITTPIQMLPKPELVDDDDLEDDDEND